MYSDKLLYLNALFDVFSNVPNTQKCNFDLNISIAKSYFDAILYF